MSEFRSVYWKVMFEHPESGLLEVSCSWIHTGLDLFNHWMFSLTLGHLSCPAFSGYRAGEDGLCPQQQTASHSTGSAVGCFIWRFTARRWSSNGLFGGIKDSWYHWSERDHFKVQSLFQFMMFCKVWLQTVKAPRQCLNHCQPLELWK